MKGAKMNNVTETQALSELEMLRQTLVNRPRNGHKGTFGTVLTVGGSRGMTGAPVLCTMASLRAGAGLGKIALPESLLPIIASQNLEYTTIPLPETSSGTLSDTACARIFSLCVSGTVAAIGPGLGRSSDLNQLVPILWERLPTPAVFDADALNALSVWSAEHDGTLPPPAALRVITPHPGEFARLVPDAPASDPEKQRAAAIAWAKKNQAVVVLKGAGTLITDGNQSSRNPSGNPGMATGGSGDVLTGITAAFCAQLLRRGVSFYDVVRLAVWIHGRAGDLAAQKVGEVSLIASDLIQNLPDAIRQSLPLTAK